MYTAVLVAFYCLSVFEKEGNESDQLIHLS